MAKSGTGSCVIAAVLFLGLGAPAWAQKPVSEGAKAAAPNAPAGKVSRVNLDSFLRKIAPALPAETWHASQLPWQPEMILAVAKHLGNEGRADKILKLWVEGRCILWEARGDFDFARCVALFVGRFKDEAGARSFLSFEVDLQRKRDTALDSGCASRVLESRLTELSLPEADQVFLSLKRRKYEGPYTSLITQTPITVETSILARVGPYVIECAWHGVSGDPSWLKWVIASLKAETVRGSAGTMDVK